MSQVSTEFQDIPVKQLGRNLDAAERLVALVSTSTDLQTRALLQEHLRYEVIVFEYCTGNLFENVKFPP